MNFRLLVSILIANYFVLSAMETPLPEEVERVLQQVQLLCKPQLKHKVEGYLSLPPQPVWLEREAFEHVRKVCINPKYAPILQELLKEKNGMRILDPNSFCLLENGRIFRLINEVVFHKAYSNVQILLEAGADPNNEACNAEEHFSFKESPLYTSVDSNDLELLESLLKGHADPNKHYEIYDNLPLVRAVVNYVEADDKGKDMTKTFSIISILLSYRASPDEKQKIANYNHKDKADLKKYYTARELAQACNATEILNLFDKQRLL
ncbi:MAG: hypothetical protein AMXMBFR12_06210 [Candidatus Babeliales bacterium]